MIPPPRVLPEVDVSEFRQCVKLSRELFAQRAFQPYRGPELQPGPGVQTDAEIDAFVRRKADSAYHPSCTCKMGAPSDPAAVVDPDARVLGLEGIRVVDASIMPSVVSGNLNAPTIMMAEKAADVIRGRPALVDPGVPVYRPATLETQRWVSRTGCVRAESCSRSHGWRLVTRGVIALGWRCCHNLLVRAWLFGSPREMTKFPFPFPFFLSRSGLLSWPSPLIPCHILINKHISCSTEHD